MTVSVETVRVAKYEGLACHIIVCYCEDENISV